MIDALKLINLPTGTGVTTKNRGDVFVLATCQRTLILGLNFVPFSYLNNSLGNMQVYNGTDAYKALMEIICGLKSQLIGENEIVAQFKEAYDNYKKLDNKNPHLMMIIEKLFKDAKQVRLKYLSEVGQQSYAGISRKIIDKRNIPADAPILIFGSGALALSLIKQLNKKYRLIITARNEKKLNDICKEFNIESIPWNRWDMYLFKRVIINTIGADTKIFDSSFFLNWQLKHSENHLFIDLGSPSVVETSLNVTNHIYRLEDVFERGAMLDKVKETRIKQAYMAIDTLTDKRRTSFTINLPFGWEELQFA